MKRFRSLRAAPVSGLLALVIAAGGALPARAAALLGPTEDIAERFSSDPRTRKDASDEYVWSWSGTWAWEPLGTSFSSDGRGAGAFLWARGGHYTGTFNLRLMLGGEGSRARLLFAFDPATGAHRWVELAAGAPGRVIAGQTGSIRGSSAGVIQAWRAPVAAGVWHDLGLAVAADGSLTVALDGATLFRAAAAPLAPGLVGFASVAGPASFDAFAFTAEPDGEPCGECHYGQAGQPLAANVYTYWDGRWWDTNKAGSKFVQQGGHGDPQGRAAVGCVGSNGCHDMRQPRPEDHRNGFREGRGRQSLNAFHLRTGFIVEAPQYPWDAQLAFDDYCTTACHSAALVTVMTHASSGIPVPDALQFGNGSTRADGETRPIPVDSDITQRATTTEPDFAPCVSCHDPHGSGYVLTGKISNRMLRANYACDRCHR